MSASPTAKVATPSTLVVTINNLPDELLELISISAGPTEYCNFRRAMKRVWEYTTGREDHCIKHFLVTKVDEDGDTETTLCGKFHSIFDQHAWIDSNGRTRGWYQHGKCHRDNDLPAYIESDGEQRWYQHGKVHRDNDQPASIHSDGTQCWYQHGRHHRDNDQPAIIYFNGRKFWFQHGEHHRDNDLPADIRPRGTRVWYQHGRRHRDNDLPAFIGYAGRKFWYKHGEVYTP